MRASWWWIDRWRKSTAYTDMTLAEQGAYRNLLDELWLRDGYLPDCDRSLANVCGDAVEWAKVRESVMSRFVETEKGWTNETALAVISKASSLHDARSKAGKVGVAKREANRQANAEAKVQANAMSPSPSPYIKESPLSVRSSPVQSNTPPATAGGGVGEGGFTGTATIYLQAYNRVFRKNLRTVAKIQKMLTRRKAYSDHELQILPFLIPTYTPRPGAPFVLHQPHVYLRDGDGREPFTWVANLLNHATEAEIARVHVEIAKDMGLWPTLTALGAREAPPPDPKVALYDR